MFPVLRLFDYKITKVSYKVKRPPIDRTFVCSFDSFRFDSIDWSTRHNKLNYTNSMYDQRWGRCRFSLKTSHQLQVKQSRYERAVCASRHIANVECNTWSAVNVKFYTGRICFSQEKFNFNTTLVSLLKYILYLLVFLNAPFSVLQFSIPQSNPVKSCAHVDS